jgi:hypothetical protein
VNEEALAHWGLLFQKQTNKQTHKQCYEAKNRDTITTKYKVNLQTVLLVEILRSILVVLVIHVTYTLFPLINESVKISI